MSASASAFAPSSGQDGAFFDHAFSTVLDVIERTRDGIVSGAFSGLDSKQKMRMSREVSRLTSRSASAMSLLLLYKALIDGQADDIDNIPNRLEDLYQGVTMPSIDDGLGDLEMPEKALVLINDAETAFGYMDRIYGMIAGQIAN